MDRLSYSQLMGHLKRRLRHARVSYARLAQALDLPESTLKKWFSARDGSFNRIQMICEVLGVSLSALILELDQQKILSLSFSSKQQELFARNDNTFRVFWFLVYERKSQEWVQQTLGLTPAELKKVLFKLDRLDLIRIDIKGVVRIPKMRPVKWVFRGPFIESLGKMWREKLIDDSQRDHPCSQQTLQFYQLSERSLSEFYKDLRELEEKYARRTILELSQDEKLQQIRYLSATAEGSFISRSSES